MTSDTKRGLRRLEIQAVAARLFNERGYDAVSIRDLAEAAGVSSGTLYWYMDNKEALLVAIHQSVLADLLERFERVSATDADPETKFRAFVHEGCEVHILRSDEASVFIRERRRLQDAYEQSIPTIERMDGLVKDVLAEGVTQGLWRAENVLPARMALWSITSFLPNWFQPDGALTGEQVTERFADFLVAGLRG